MAIVCARPLLSWQCPKGHIQGNFNCVCGGVSVVELYNSLGQKVATVEGSEYTSIDVTSFDNGVYVVRVIDNEGVVTTKKVTISR